MNALEKNRASDPRDIDFDPLTMALAILMDRIKRLPREDQEDLFALAKELPGVQTREEYDSIGRAMREILDQTPTPAQRMDLGAEGFEPLPGLKRWVDFVSEKLRTTREAAGLTQADVAEKTGIPQSHISRLENGNHSPSRSTLEKIAKALDVPVSAFDPSA